MQPLLNLSIIIIMGLIINNTELNIGDLVYAVHKKYVDEKLGGRIIVCRVRTFENSKGEIIPILTEVGNVKNRITSENNYIYHHINAAIDAIRTKPVNF